MAEPIVQSTSTTSGAPIRYLSTTAAYDLWASVYDTDGNFLQAMDNIEMKSLFPNMVSNIKSEKPWKLVDLGCGTGRNTVALLGVADAEVVALDASPKMLEVAKSRLQDITKQSASQSPIRFEVIDLIESMELPLVALNADAVVSTLVIEHIPCDIFFRHVAQMLKPRGILLLTNMHAQMGSLSQAGFVDSKTGEKVRPTSYAHTVDNILAAASKFGLEPIGKIEERAVNEASADVLGQRSKKWIGVTVWFGGLFRKA
jgi:ubiquinone/menaquinone biosynthesis C-methylase UbiE